MKKLIRLIGPPLGPRDVEVNADATSLRFAFDSGKGYLGADGAFFPYFSSATYKKTDREHLGVEIWEPD